MRLRKPCEHDRYEEHPCIDGKWVSQLRLMRITDEERPLLTLCPGGEFLPEDAIVIEKLQSAEWTALVERITEAMFLVPFHGEMNRDFVRRQAVAALKSLAADQVGEPG